MSAAPGPSRDIVVSHPGTQHSWQTARALDDLARLAFYTTSIHYDPTRFPYVLERLPGPLGLALGREFRRFAIPGLDPARIRAGGWHEWAERLATRARQPGIARRLDAAGNRAFARKAARDAIGAGARGFWGYDNSSLASFSALEGSGVARILEVTIAPRRALNRIMAELADDWGQFLLPGHTIIPEPVLRDAEDELRHADVIAVGSPFVRDTILAEMPDDTALASKVRILPYSFDAALFAGQTQVTAAARSGPVRFLFVGSIGARKGAHLLLEAIMRLPPSEASLTMVGSVDMPAATFARYGERITHIPHLPRSAIAGVMAQHDVLVLPSYFEGSAITLLEALASGLALIQSSNAGLGVTPDTGVMLRELSVAALEEALRVPIEDRSRLAAWREAAPQRAEEFTFARYRQGIAALLADAGL